MKVRGDRLVSALALPLGHRAHDGWRNQQMARLV
jgi:hypothetical protein